MARTVWTLAIFASLTLATGVAASFVLSSEAEDTVTPRRVPVVTVSRVIPPASLREAMSLAEGRIGDDIRQQAYCLAQAVYFEARSEPLEGQLAVAQVVLNRVDSPFWPNEICAVVFQNQHMRHRCQFSFACDGLSETPRNRQAWRIAEQMAGVALNGLWDDVTNGSTHYHADYVQPDWRNMMHPTVAHGRHLFYRDWRHASLFQTAAASAES